MATPSYLPKVVLVNVVLTAICLALLTLLLFSHDPTSRRFAYINTADVYDNFQMKKQLQDRVLQLKKTRKIFLDSLKTSIVMAERAMPANSKEGQNDLLARKQDYLEKEKQFNGEEKELVGQYDKEIWTQLNQYIKDYGAHKGFDIILGATGTGNIMYANEGLDITKEIVAYVNQQYKGGTEK